MDRTIRCRAGFEIHRMRALVLKLLCFYSARIVWRAGPGSWQRLLGDRSPPGTADTPPPPPDSIGVGLDGGTEEWSEGSFL